MGKRGAGIAFIAISAFLISTKYISAAIFGSGVSSWSQELFDGMLSYLGYTLNIFSVLSLLVGILYLVWGEYKELKRQR
ncbi:hypothetical protein [Bhargavaea massiliensis]|uniref:hypothetical protein n=1 Tax=Bhargavaea massiliensis TaxID=2697500 RepID=UPI001BCEA707|nr:hypothetical protein [Bhargavaea massiliensis]